MKLSAKKDLVALKQKALLDVDGQADKQRMTLMPNFATHMIVHLAKLNEAQCYLAANEEERSGNFAFLSAEVGITGATLEEVASAIVDRNNKWSQAMAQIEKKRLAAKKSIREATQPVALMDIDWKINP